MQFIALFFKKIKHITVYCFLIKTVQPLLEDVFSDFN